MEEQNHRSYLQDLPLENDWIASNASGLPTNFDSDQPCIMAQGSGGHLGPVPVHHWMHYQPTPENYVQFLDETVYPEMQKQMSYDISAQLPTLGLPNPYQLEEYMRPHDGGDFVTTVTGLEQLGFQKQKWNEECNYDFETYSQSAVAGSKELSKVKRKRSRQRAYSTDRYRRLRISHGLDALQELVPHPEGAGQGALLDGVIDHIKYLQYQVQDLCRNRLGGESTSNSVIFLEEHGHYFVQDQMLNGPLEEMIGKLIDVYPSAATELLQSRGLIVLPMNFAEGLLESTDMLAMQVVCCSTLKTRGNKSTVLLALRIKMAKEQMHNLMKEKGEFSDLQVIAQIYDLWEDMIDMTVVHRLQLIRHHLSDEWVYGGTRIGFENRTSLIESYNHC